MKKQTFFFCVVFAAGIILLSGCRNVAPGGSAAMTPGSYQATAQGFYGDFEVTVTVSETAITGITTGPYQETEALGGKAIKLLIQNIIQANTAGVDHVSGATVTSAAFKAAVAQALAQAGAPEALTAVPLRPAQAEETLTTDVLVIGAGAAGFSAAITAAQGGANVIIIEKQDIIGGSTVTSAGIVYAALDSQDYDRMVNYYLQRAGGNADRAMLTYFAQHSLETISFLEDLGVKWMMTIPAGTAPEPRARFSMHDDGTAMIGSSLINPMEAAAKALGVTILTGLRATSLIQNDAGAVTGAIGESRTTRYTLNAGAVILATGGFDASEELKARYAPVAVGDFPLSSKGNVGDGIIMGQAAGAAVEFKGGVIGFEIVDGSLPSSGFNAAAMYCQIFVRTDGTFIGPCEDYPINYTTFKRIGDSQYLGLFDAANVNNPMVGNLPELAIARGFGWQGDTVQALAAAAGMDPSKLADAIRQGGLGAGPYYAVVAKASTIGSMGGLKTNTRAEVLREGTGQPIPGLYAAGEVANGAFYNQEYPASGSSNSLSITFGRAAGTNAAAYLKR
ncbi:MAG: FAD-dependent oxidoreductase [Spirochaetales bacterium]|jgi:fumarate reductase flavoprotein subunit|nr:FAD-dependent oxidoreductase [Spirochaetales bacterium]